MTNWDPYQHATGTAPSSALCRPPDPSYKADNRTGLYTEKVDYSCSLQPNSRTWITLGKCAIPFAELSHNCHFFFTYYKDFYLIYCSAALTPILYFAGVRLRPMCGLFPTLSIKSRFGSLNTFETPRYFESP